VSRGRIASALVLVLLISCLPPEARGQSDVYVGGVVTGEYLYNTDEEASVADGRFELDLGVGPVTVGGVFRAYQLSDPSYNPAAIYVPPAGIKQRYAAYEQGDLLLRAGSFFETFGRGITLRSYEEVAVEHDTSLDGLLTEYRLGPTEWALLAGVTGDDHTPTQRTEYTIRAARAGVRATDWLSLAASAVERISLDVDDDIDLPEATARFEDTVLGGELDAWLGPVTLGAEYATRNGEYPAGEEALDGHATYVTATAQIDWLTLFGEFKDYEAYEHYVVNPPTAVSEHLWTLMNRATYQVNLNDEVGWLAEANAPVGGKGSLMFGSSEARRHDNRLRHWEMYGYYVHDLSENARFAIAGSWQREYLFQGDDWTSKYTEHLIGVGELEFIVGGTQTIEITLEGQRVEEPSLETYNDYIAAAAWYPTLETTVIGTFETTTRDLVGAPRDSWLLLEVRRMILDYDLEVSLAGGTQRGGKVCTGGVCLFEPEFAGARLRFTKYF